MIKICITGRKQVGKDLTYKIINMMLHGVSNHDIYDVLDNYVFPTWKIGKTLVPNIKFAKPVYDILSLLTNKSVEYIQEHKEDVCVFGMKYREALQIIGTDLLRNRFNPDVFVISAIERGDLDNDAIITDCRFPNEADGCSNFIILKLINEKDTNKDTHESESYINDIKADYIIYTQGKLTKCLISEVRDFLVANSII